MAWAWGSGGLDLYSVRFLFEMDFVSSFIQGVCDLLGSEIYTTVLSIISTILACCCCCCC